MDDRNMDENHSIGNNSYKILKIYSAQSCLQGMASNARASPPNTTRDLVVLSRYLSTRTDKETKPTKGWLVKNIYHCKYNESKPLSYMAYMMCLHGPPMNLFDSKYDFALLYFAPC